MLLQVLSNIIVIILKFAIWVVVAVAAIPFGVFMLLKNLFPLFTQDAGFWFWSLFGILTVVVYVILWKPILWIIGTVSVLGTGH